VIYMVDKNSLLYWYPKIKDIVPAPKTDWVELPEVNSSRNLLSALKVSARR